MAAADGSGRQARVTSEGGCEGDGNSKGQQAKATGKGGGAWTQQSGERNEMSGV